MSQYEPGRRCSALLTLCLALAIGIPLGGSPSTAAPPEETSQEAPRVLFLSKSSGFIHGVIARKEGAPSVVATALAELGDEHGFEVVDSKDAGLVRRETLDDFDAVIFYTTGDLTVSGGEGKGGDGEPAMGPEGLADLLAWIEEGGAFLGFHCASDTFHSEPGEVSDYIAMLGGEFETHGRPFEGTLIVTDPSHPTAQSIPDGYAMHDEWYMFRNFDRDGNHVIAKLDPIEAQEKQEMYRVEPYPVIWVREQGKGRVYYNAMGHMPEVWQDGSFRQMVVDALEWTMGNGG